jgi:hypothetical protein
VRQLEALGGPLDGDRLWCSDRVAEGRTDLRVREGKSYQLHVYRAGEDPTNYYNVVLHWEGVIDGLLF